MRTLAIVQARTQSSRLPGKVLAPLAGRPLLAFMLARLVAAPVDELVVATTTTPSDDLVADVALAAGVAVVRGSEFDVLGRFTAALDTHPADLVVRLTADCPLIDAGLVGHAIACHRITGAEYVSNTLVRTYPDGLDVEVLTAGALQAAAEESGDPIEREHVTPFVYRRPERFALGAFVGRESLGHLRWTVDTADDLARVRAIVNALEDPLTAGWREVLAVARHPDSVADNGLALRVARGADDELFRPPAPFGESLLNPGIRSWVAEAGGHPTGWAQISVVGGIGYLDHWIEGGESEDRALVGLVRRALTADYQVSDLRAGPQVLGSRLRPAPHSSA